jgi:threonine/homoserine/homoserine lactone efflux protein
MRLTPLNGNWECRLRSRPGMLVGLYRCSGAILIGLGLKLALERRV